MGRGSLFFKSINALSIYLLHYEVCMKCMMSSKLVTACVLCMYYVKQL